MRWEVGMVMMNANTSSMKVLNAYNIIATHTPKYNNYHDEKEPFSNIIHECSPGQMGHRFQL
jgi:hypothetical protein